MKKINYMFLGISALITLSSCSSQAATTKKISEVKNTEKISEINQENYIKPGQKAIYDALYTHSMHQDDMHDYYHNHIHEDMMEDNQMIQDEEIVDFMDPNFDMSKIESHSCCHK